MERNSSLHDLKISDHFPLVVPQCKEVAAEFFYCFSREGTQQGKNELEKYRGQTALLACQQKMKAYDDCMLKRNLKTTKFDSDSNHSSKIPILDNFLK